MKKLRQFYRYIKYWFILKFDKSVFTILVSDNYFNLYDTIATESGQEFKIIKIKNNTLYVRDKIL